MTNKYNKSKAINKNIAIGKVTAIRNDKMVNSCI